MLVEYLVEVFNLVEILPDEPEEPFADLGFEVTAVRWVEPPNVALPLLSICCPFAGLAFSEKVNFLGVATGLRAALHNGAD